MTPAAAARKIAEDLIALAAKATPGPWDRDPWRQDKDDRNACGISTRIYSGANVALFRAPNFTSQSEWNNNADYVIACVPEAITALAQAYLSLSRPQAGTWEPIETFVLEDRATAIVACPSLNKPGEWIIGEAVYICDDKPVDRGLWWWANTGPGDYFASPIIETNGAPAYWQPLPAAPSLTTPPATEEDA